MAKRGLHQLRNRSRKGAAKIGKSRNWLAVHAHFRTGAGNHGDKRKQASKNACRGRVTA